MKEVNLTKYIFNFEVLFVERIGVSPKGCVMVFPAPLIINFMLKDTVSRHCSTTLIEHCWPNIMSH